MTPPILSSILSALSAAGDVLAEICGSEDPRVQVLRLELQRAKELMEEAVEPKPAVLGVRRPTLIQAVEQAPQLGVTEKEAEDWFYAREATDWVRGTMGGGSLPVGTNWQADCKTYVNSVRQRQPMNGHINGTPKPKADTVWSLKQSLEAVNAEIEEIESYRATGAWGELPVSKRREKDKLLERKSELRRKIATLGS